jgi:hypothetical protein
VEWCGLMAGSALNGFVKLWIEVFKVVGPNLIHPCPYPEGKIDINATFKEDHFSVFPIGQYVMTFNVSSSRKQMFNIEYELESFY